MIIKKIPTIKTFKKTKLIFQIIMGKYGDQLKNIH